MMYTNNACRILHYRGGKKETGSEERLGTVKKHEMGCVMSFHLKTTSKIKMAHLEIKTYRLRTRTVENKPLIGLQTTEAIMPKASCCMRYNKNTHRLGGFIFCGSLLRHYYAVIRCD